MWERGTWRRRKKNKKKKEKERETNIKQDVQRLLLWMRRADMILTNGKCQRQKVEAKGKGKKINKSMKDVSRANSYNNNNHFSTSRRLTTDDPPTTLWMVDLWCLFVYSAYCCWRVTIVKKTRLTHLSCLLDRESIIFLLSMQYGWAGMFKLHTRTRTHRETRKSPTLSSPAFSLSALCYLSWQLIRRKNRRVQRHAYVCLIPIALSGCRE